MRGYESNEPPSIAKKQALEEKEKTPKKDLVKYVQRNHSEDQIIGDKNEGVQTRRRIEKTNEQVKLNCFYQR